MSGITSSGSGIEKINNRWHEIDSMAGVGIDPVISKIPDEIWLEVGRDNDYDAICMFNRKIIDATAEYTVDYKINLNFFQGEVGRRALEFTFSYLKNSYPNILRVCDGKFADVGHTAEVIADEIFGNLDADAVLLNPYMGQDAIKPFTQWKNKLAILCVNTSNNSACEVQDLVLDDGCPLWRRILYDCYDKWNDNNNIVPVMSATHPENLVGIRDIIGDCPILLAGVGSQGGSVSETVPNLLNSDGYGLMIGSSRGILYSEKESGETFELAARRKIKMLRDEINQAKEAR
jgi:orotidine-5'-phosphate decarboxylase